MKEIAAIILQNDKGEFFLALRDNKPGIPFPNHWDLIGGHVEKGETPEEALIREVKEELDIAIIDYTFYKKFECLEGDVYPNIKYIYKGKINIPIDKITLLEGERAQYFSREEVPDLRFANIIRSIILEYINDHIGHPDSMFKFHQNADNLIAELYNEKITISSTQDALDLFGELIPTDCYKIIIAERHFHPDFFNLATGVAGDILQKFSNYNLKLAIIGDFTKYKSKSLQDFIRESNKGNRIFFLQNLDEALNKLR